MYVSSIDVNLIMLKGVNLGITKYNIYILTLNCSAWLRTLLPQLHINLV